MNLKRIISIFLSLALIFITITTSPTEVKAATTINIGDYIYFGQYNGEPILWRVINLDEDGDPLLWSEYIISYKPFDAAESGVSEETGGSYSNNEDRQKYGSNRWHNSNLREWLNSNNSTVAYTTQPPTELAVWDNDYANEVGFLYNFTKEEQQVIKPVTHKTLLIEVDMSYVDGGSELHYYMLDEFDMDSTAVTVVTNYNNAFYEWVTDQVFLLSIKEVADYIEARDYEWLKEATWEAYNKDESGWAEVPDNYDSYWLRSPYYRNSSFLLSVYDNGTVDNVGYSNTGSLGVVPALYIDMDSVIFTSGQGTKSSPYVAEGIFSNTKGNNAEGYIVLGTNFPTLHGGEDVWVIKVNSSGEIEWEKTYGGSFQDESYSIQQTEDGDYIVLGTTYSNDGHISTQHGGGDMWVIKLNPSGEIEWEKTYGGSDIDWGISFEQTEDGGSIVVGFTDSIDGDISVQHDGKDIWVIKLNPSGEIEWEKTYGDSDSEWGSSVQQTEDGGYIVLGGTTSTEGDINAQAHERIDMWVIKLNPSGEIEWEKTYGGSDYDWGSSIQQIEGRGYIVLGGTKSTDGDISNQHGGEDMWVIKLNPLGEIEWEKTYGGSDLDCGNSIQQTEGGGYIVLGETESTDGDIRAQHGEGDIWVIKLNPSGEVEWEKTYGGSDRDRGGSIQQTEDGGSIVVGSTDSTDGDISVQHGGGDMWVIKLNPSGEIEWEKTYGGSWSDKGFSIQQITSNDLIELKKPSITFLDKNLETAIRQELGKVGGDILEEDVALITNLNAGGMNIKNIEGIEELKNLKRLNISYNDIEDIEPLKSLENLEAINITESITDENKLTTIINYFESKGVDVTWKIVIVDNEEVEALKDRYEDYTIENLAKEAEAIIKESGKVEVELDENKLIINASLLKKELEAAIDTQKQLEYMLKEDEVALDRTLESVVEIELKSVKEDKAIELAFSKDLSENKEIDKINVNAGDVTISITPKQLEKATKSSETLKVEIENREETITSTVIAEVQEYTEKDNISGIQKLLNDIKIINRTIIAEASDNASEIITAAETIEQKKNTKVYSVNINDGAGLKDSKLGISLASDNNKYNCIFKKIKDNLEAIGGKYDEATGKMSVEIDSNGDYYVINNQKNFEDIKTLSLEEKEAINILASKDILRGERELFNPDKKVNRAEITTALVKVTNLYNQNAESDFIDVEQSAWYYPYISSSKEVGIVSGYPDNTFKPDNAITKVELTKLEAALLSYIKGYKYPEQKEIYLNMYSNPEEIAEWALDYVALATREGIVITNAEQLFDGETEISRVDAAMMLYRLYERL